MKVHRWFLSIGKQVLRAFGIGRKPVPLEWGVSVSLVKDRQLIDSLWWTQHAIVTSRGGKAAYPNPEGLRYAVYSGERFPDGSLHWGKYWAHSRVIVVLKRYENRKDLWAHECRHDVLGTEQHPTGWFRGSSLDLP